MMRADTKVIEVFTAPVAKVAYWELFSDNPADSKILVE